MSVHFLAHCNNPCLQEITRSCNCIEEALNVFMEAIQLLKLSPKHQESIQKLEEPRAVSVGIRTLCPTVGGLLGLVQCMQY